MLRSFFRTFIDPTQVTTRHTRTAQVSLIHRHTQHGLIVIHRHASYTAHTAHPLSFLRSSSPHHFTYLSFLSLSSPLFTSHTPSYVLLPEGNRRRPSKRRSMIAPRRRRARVTWRRAGRLREGLPSLLRPLIPPPIEPRLVRVLARRLTRLPR